MFSSDGQQLDRALSYRYLLIQFIRIQIATPSELINKNKPTAVARKNMFKKNHSTSTNGSQWYNIMSNFPLKQRIIQRLIR